MRRALRVGAAVVIAVLVAGAATVGVATWWWGAVTARSLNRLSALEMDPLPRGDVERDLAAVPPVVARYLRATGALRGTVTEARIASEGTFLVKADPETWGPFTAEQMFTTSPPGFVWDARIWMSGIPAYVRDAFIGATGSMHGSVLGAVTVVHPPASLELDAGSLHRYLAEAIWFPTALLPGRGVTWAALTDSSARAAITAGRTTVTLDFFFGADGLATRLYTAGRYADRPGGAVPQPWEVRLRRYEHRAGMLIPVDCEVGWIEDGEWQPYWRGTLTTTQYTWADPPS